MNPLILHIAEHVRAHNGRALLVGGCVRDQLLGITPKDYDMEVFRIGEMELEELLHSLGHVSRVGRSFPVWKVWNDATGQGAAIDVALPRLETKVGEHHTDFAVTFDPHMTFEAAASRRDFSLNAMGRDPLTNELLDPHGGADDLRAGLLRHTSSHFVEDPLRVLRGMQFCARFQLTAVPETIELCRTLTPAHLSAERLWEEWTKLILKGVKPSMGLSFLRTTGWLKHFPELEFMTTGGCQDEALSYDEDDLWTHTLKCLDHFAECRQLKEPNEREDLIVGLAVLCHEMRRTLYHAVIENDDNDAVERFLGRMTIEAGLIEEIQALVSNVGVAHAIWFDYSDAALRRLSCKVNLTRLSRVIGSDGRGLEAKWLWESARRLGILTSKPSSLLMGRHLIDLGLKPGPAFKSILDAAYQKQLDGDITTVDDATLFAKMILDGTLS